MRVSQLRWVVLIALLISATGSFAEEPRWQHDSARSPELGKLLRELHQKYGPDTVSLLSWLNDATIRSGSILTATVRVDGKETRENVTFLVFSVETGIIFNTQTVDQTGRLMELWEKILADSFSHLEDLQVPADGVLIDLRSHCKAFAETDNIADHVDEPGLIEDVKFYFPGEPLRAYLQKQLSVQTLLSRTTVLVNDVPVTFSPSDKTPKTEAGATPLHDSQL
jgi:hypothetical protein